MLENGGQGSSSFQVPSKNPSKMDQQSQKIEFDRTHVHSLHRFVKHPEYLKEGQRLVFREGRTKAVGNVNKVAATKCNQM